ncbi:MAG: ADP-forming succinate--CoA ligase subunit beta [Candidatus Neomarinimicrobiota bacterium]|nr:MAG: ADP-forming succinate--CoA ligase subunit beta [Candidatus Neomarinimicrobiota bacterium]
MKIHEYQSKEILKKFNVNIPKGKSALSKEEAIVAADEVAYPCVIKAQIHAGGRGKGGGVKVAKSREEAISIINELFGKRLITVQTGPGGKIVNRLLIEEAINIERELYVSIVIDREKALPVMMVSTEGGVEIEKIAKETPEKIVKEYAIPGLGLQRYQLRHLAFALGLEGQVYKKGIKFLASLFNVFRRTDASLVEVNPLVITSNGEMIALDAKINFDDNSLFRHKEFLELRDLSEEEPSEVEASKYKLNYIRLSGNVGCMVNGAGLAMATMDIIKLFGGEPANFLDVGGIASSETVANGFKILLSDPNVKAVLINIFGGIVRCDRVASGIVNALKTMDIKIPIVIRLEGTNAKEASKILSESSLNFIIARNLKESAEKAVSAANFQRSSKL